MSRPNPNNKQYGNVVYLGIRHSREKHHVKTTPHESIEIDFKGVVGDYHAHYLEPDPIRLPEYKKAEAEILEKHQQGYKLFRLAQVHVMDTNTASTLKTSLDINLAPGIAGEQILLDGVDLNACHAGTHIKLGNEVVLEIICCRSYCYRFSADIETNNRFNKIELEHKIMRSLFVTRTVNNGSAHLGIYAHVVQGGQIKVGDTVEVDPTTSKFYNTSDTPMLPEKANEIRDARFRWFNYEELLAYDTINSKDKIAKFFNL